MEHNTPINEIVERARKLGLAMRELCEEAGVNHSTWWRWQQPDANPRLRDMRHALEAMDRALVARELAALEELADRYPDAARGKVSQQEEREQ